MTEGQISIFVIIHRSVKLAPIIKLQRLSRFFLLRNGLIYTYGREAILLSEIYHPKINLRKLFYPKNILLEMYFIRKLFNTKVKYIVKNKYNGSA